MPSVTNKGISKIAPELTLGARRGDHPLARALVRHRKRRRQSVREIAAGACAADYQRVAHPDHRKRSTARLSTATERTTITSKLRRKSDRSPFRSAKNSGGFYKPPLFLYRRPHRYVPARPRSNIFGNQFPVRPLFIGGAGSVDSGSLSFATIVPEYCIRFGSKPYPVWPVRSGRKS